ncbi:DUF2892 domain-containing protein [Aestuariicella sp. G3-2]|uniref:YgaP family membrane protein n=1 Tax=Pseudomaricurvus albidus TaxID=2842452 RepID=UPI001C0C9A97|nr:DUF2892 domain-containing protein [Aestuariicella albida]
MIEKNIGNIERIFRVLFGVILAAWAAIQPDLNGIEWFVLVISLMLVLNGVFSRCYFWYILDINTCSKKDKNCIENETPCL